MRREAPDRAVRWSEDNPFASIVPRVTPWRLVVLVLAGAAWLVPVAGVWFVGLVGLVGWSGENDTTTGLLDEPSLDALATVLSAAFVIVVGAAVLVMLARWALPFRRRAATVLGLVVALWLPAFLTLGTIWMLL